MKKFLIGVFFLILLFLAGSAWRLWQHKQSDARCAASLRATQDSLKKVINLSAVIIDSVKRSTSDPRMLEELARLNSIRERLRPFESEPFPEQDSDTASFGRDVKDLIFVSSALVRDPQLFVSQDSNRASVVHQDLLNAWSQIPMMPIQCE